MSVKMILLGGVMAVLASVAMAEGSIEVRDGYLITSRPNAPTAAAFMELANSGDQDDRLVSAASEAASMVALHTHEVDDNGVARMGEIEGGLPLGAGISHALERGGDHIMLMGLTRPLNDGDTVQVTLTFERAGEISIDLPVNPAR